MSITVLTLTNRTPAPERDVFLKGFLALPKALYPRERRTQDTKAERAILNGTHPLSGEFTVRAYLAVDDGASPQGRCVLTYYPDDPAAYVGFFECVEDLDVCRALLSAAEAQARADGKEKLVGPLNASFWIGYRFKVENFDEHFTGEPDNLPYYAGFWEACGFTVSERYYSNYLRSPTPEDPSEKWEKRLQQALDKGYEIRSLERGKFDEALRDIYRMLVRLYAKFPAFKLISEEQFTARRPLAAGPARHPAHPQELQRVCHFVHRRRPETPGPRRSLRPDHPADRSEQGRGVHRRTHPRRKRFGRFLPGTDHPHGTLRVAGKSFVRRENHAFTDSGRA